MVRASLVQLLLFITAVSVSTLFVGMVVTETGLYAQSSEAESERDVAVIDAEIAVINDVESDTIYDDTSDEVTVYLKNVGGGTLDPAETELLVDGEYVQPEAMQVLDAGDSWRESTVLEVTLPAALEPGNHRVVATVDSAREHFEFEHRVAFWTSPAGQNGTADDCDADECTVYLDEVDDGNLTLEMATELPQPDESVTYASSNSSVGTVDPVEGTTDGAGTNATTLVLEETGNTTVTLDIGWDADEILIVVEASRSE